MRKRTVLTQSTHAVGAARGPGSLCQVLREVRLSGHCVVTVTPKSEVYKKH